jgi:hypothetical protein
MERADLEKEMEIFIVLARKKIVRDKIHWFVNKIVDFVSDKLLQRSTEWVRQILKQRVFIISKKIDCLIYTKSTDFIWKCGISFPSLLPICSKDRPNEEVSNNTTTNNILIKIWGFDFQKTLWVTCADMTSRKWTMERRIIDIIVVGSR